MLGGFGELFISFMISIEVLGITLLSGVQFKDRAKVFYFFLVSKLVSKYQFVSQFIDGWCDVICRSGMVVRHGMNSLSLFSRDNCEFGVWDDI